MRVEVTMVLLEGRVRNAFVDHCFFDVTFVVPGGVFVDG
jgi:hypothetical protein